jgi:monoamine oxidase
LLFNILKNSCSITTLLARLAESTLASTAKKDSKLSRRAFLRSSAAAAAIVAGSGSRSSASFAYRSGIQPRIAIIGAGIAGLTAAYELRKLGLKPMVYEASARSGGRIYTAHDLFHRGQWTELGGEFIDSSHTGILELAREFHLLKLIDREAEEHPALAFGKVHGENGPGNNSHDAAGPNDLEPHTFFEGGTRRSTSEVREAFRAIAPKLRADISAIPAAPGYRSSTDVLRSLDATSLESYLGSLDTEPWFRTLLDVAYMTEFGLQTSEQSALNFLTMIDPALSGTEFRPYGQSDERFKIYGGNAKLTDALAKHVETIHYDNRLTSLRAVSGGYRLSFDGTHTRSLEITADFVILAIPFTMLRMVDVRLELPPVKRRAIEELGYGTSAKTIVGTSERAWRVQHSSGYAITDLGFQSGWDSAEGQPGRGASYTMFTGGHGTNETGRPVDIASKYLKDLEQVFPGSNASYTGKVVRFDWSSYPYSLGGYACYRPGQWTGFGGVEGESIGNLYFAGEHCSPEFQGFMNGAVESGKAVARTIRVAITGKSDCRGQSEATYRF